MATTDTLRMAGADARELDRASASPSRQAFQILRFGFTVAPIVAGLDKFFDALVNWDQFMQVVGVIEIVAGIGVALRPRIFSYVVAAWLAGIIVNLLLIPGYYDVALRDLGLALAALALGRLSAEHAAR